MRLAITPERMCTDDLSALRIPLRSRLTRSGDVNALKKGKSVCLSMRQSAVRDVPAGRAAARWLRRLGRSTTVDAVEAPSSSQSTDLAQGYFTRLAYLAQIL